MSVSDNFNRADSASLGANWTVANGTSLKILFNTCRPTDGTDGVEWWNANSFSDTHSSQADIVSNSLYSGLVVRFRGTSSASNGGYVWHAVFGGIYKMVNGSFTLLQGSVSTPSNGDTILMSVSGTTITCKINGTTATNGTVTDASFSTGGAPGVFMNEGGGGPQLDNWIGTGEIAGGGTNWGPSLLADTWNRIVQGKGEL